MRTRLPLLLSFFLAAACGGGDSSTDAGPTDAGPTDTGTATDTGTDTGASADLLIGTWFEQVTPVTSDNQTATFTFRADMTFTYVHTQFDGATTGLEGCTETQTDVGTFTESDASGPMRLSLTSNAAMSGNVVRSGCTDPTNDGPGSPGTPIAVLSTPYTVTATTLTLNDLSGTPVSTLMRH